jgi:hypothetical protein
MPTPDKKPFIHLCLFGSLTLLAILNMVYLIVKARDPFPPYLLEGLIGSVPLFPYFVLSLNATIILLTGTLLTLTSAIQADAEVLLHQHVMHEHVVPEASPHTHAEPTPSLIVTHMPPASSEEAMIHALNEQVQTLHTAITQQRRDALVHELQEIPIATPVAESPEDSAALRLGVEDHPPIPQLTLHSSPRAINGIGVKTEAALHGIDVTTVGEFLVADPEWIAERTSMTTKRVQQFQNAAYTRVTAEAQQQPSPLTITPLLA